MQHNIVKALVTIPEWRNLSQNVENVEKFLAKMEERIVLVQCVWISSLGVGDLFLCDLGRTSRRCPVGLAAVMGHWTHCQGKLDKSDLDWANTLPQRAGVGAVVNLGPQAT